jgi:hypothetical protein
MSATRCTTSAKIESGSYTIDLTAFGSSNRTGSPPGSRIRGWFAGHFPIIILDYPIFQGR